MRSGRCACWATRLESKVEFVTQDGRCNKVGARVTRLVGRKIDVYVNKLSKD